MEAPTLRPGDRVRNRKSGDLGTIKSRAKLQVGPSVSEENPLWVVNYARLGALRDVSVKQTSAHLELIERGEKNE